MDRNLSSYVAFATDNFDMKAGDSAGHSLITGGDVGVNNPGEWDSAPRMHPCTNGTLTMDDDSRMNSDTTKINTNCSLWDLYTNTLTGTPTVDVPHSSVTHRERSHAALSALRQHPGVRSRVCRARPLPTVRRSTTK